MHFAYPRHIAFSDPPVLLSRNPVLQNSGFNHLMKVVTVSRHVVALVLDQT